MEDPRPAFKRGGVADVLLVPAFQIGDPIPVFIGVEAYHFALHALE